MSFYRVISKINEPSPKNKSQYIIPLFYLGIFFVYITDFINPNTAFKGLVFTAIISIFVSVIYIKRLLSDKRMFIFPSAVLAFGLLQIIWIAICKTPSSHFTGTYHAYQSGGKTLIFSALVILGLTAKPQNDLQCSRRLNYIILTVSSLLYIWISYLCMLHSENILTHRFSFPAQNPTGTAYALTALGLLTGHASCLFRKKISALVYLFYFLLCYSSIMLTQTRAAIIVYPLLAIIQFFYYFRSEKKILINSVVMIFIFLIILFISFRPILESRYYDLTNDIHKYSQEKSKTSVGARIAMQRAGLAAGKEHPFGSSLDTRNTMIINLAKTDPSLQGAVLYLNVHMHNELIDTFSLKGIVGVIILLSLYISIIYTSFIYKNYTLLLIGISIIAFGLSDLVMFAQGETLISMLSLSIALIISSNSPPLKKIE